MKLVSQKLNCNGIRWHAKKTNEKYAYFNTNVFTVKLVPVSCLGPWSALVTGMCLSDMSLNH